MRIPTPTKEEIDLFWSIVTRKGKDDCWFRGNNRKWYGKFRYQGTSVLTNRFVAFLKYGPIPPERFACHTCDVPACCNPDHIFLGTRTDNAVDAHQKRRTGILAKPERYEFLKLSPSLIRKIRKAKGSSREIAIRFKLSQSHISRIKNRKAWAWVD